MKLLNVKTRLCLNEKQPKADKTRKRRQKEPNKGVEYLKPRGRIMAKNEGFVDNETEKGAKIRYHNKKAKGHSIEDEKEIRAATEPGTIPTS
ncbi:MAG: hypothetical protein AYP45_17520 [Candidatus Brocadia carolinensis]|uniref:Uncharacterized protein n=1 Tax=Candidatus Brocadia carolinensis TaxID=1004156 RepID=A0A1V4APB4_9BACT|nr:MAG: hypothetical protein AYP45_17520 [Candidatus Brocadia caroliniensis]